MLKKKNGFTLVEVVISIVVLVLLTVLVGSRIIDSNAKSKQKLYDAKIKVALRAAENYGNDVLDELSATTCYDTTITNLIKLRYLASDSNTNYEYSNPKDNTSLTNKIICIKYINGKVEASLK